MYTEPPVVHTMQEIKAAAYQAKCNMIATENIVELEVPFFLLREAEQKKLGRRADKNEIVLLQIDRRTLGQSFQIDHELKMQSPADLREHTTKVEEPMAKEWASWNDHGSLKLRLRSKAKNVIGARLLHKWKIIDGKKEIQSRLCVRGFKDQQEETRLRLQPPLRPDGLKAW